MSNQDQNEQRQANVHSVHDLDDLFDYDVGLDNILNGISTSPDRGGRDALKANAGPSLSLGLDEELKVFKNRIPVAKLDEHRLLSKHGIQKLRKTAKSKLKFKGKGHEFSDMACLLNFYQLWLDDLFPRAKFADGLAMIEKLGHSKRIQITRREWIDDEKPKVSDADMATEQTARRAGEDNDGGVLDHTASGPANAATSISFDTNL